MIPPNSSATPGAPMGSPAPDNSRQRLIAITAVVIVVLLGVIAFLLVNKFKQDRQSTELTTQLSESETLKAELEKQYYDALSQLEEMKGSNTELNARIETQMEELASQKAKIDQLLVNKGSLDKARSELKKLNGQVEQYLAEINQLRQENMALGDQNRMLSQEKDSLSGNLEAQRMTNQELASAKEALASEKARVEQERTVLAKKVDRASMISVQGLEVTGLKSKEGGKSVKKNYADNIDQLQVCFNTTANDVAENGKETYYIRIISPLGETLAVEGLGSGAFTAADNDQIRYTMSKEFNYSGTPQKMCSVWSPGQPFSKGKYEVEVYNKGYLAGKGSVVLK
ncbi:MAG: hypothetical protein KAX50_07310 [Saprospiraceae bacterium]|nr:hypothetical protein [Saprospiraceae bacterium]